MDISNLFQFNKFIPFDAEGCINIMGFKLHCDDLLILALLFFFYTQKVKDKYLLFALFFLLL